MKITIPLNSILFLLFVLLISNSISQDDDEYETILVELQMADFDLSDSYDEISEITKGALLGFHGFEERVLAEKERGRLMREQSDKNRNYENELPYDLIRNWTLLTKTGDLLLPENDLNSLIDFHNANGELANQAKIACLGNTSDCTIDKQGVTNILATNRNLKVLNATWSSWQEIFEKNKDKFDSNLQIVNKAFLPNEEHNARSYWEMLSEYEDGYMKAQNLWNEVQPLYKKLHEFVRIRLFNYYNINRNESAIPVYLLGDNFGTDWSNIADIILPHPYLYKEVETELKYRTVKDIYELAENATRTMGLGPLGKKFWTKSNFNFSSCGPHIFSHCGQQYTEIITCSNKLGWKEYLDIHEASFVVTLRNLDYSSIPRQELRFSAVNEALKGLGSFIAIENLPFYEIISEDAFVEGKDLYNRKQTALLLLALRILPKLPYYLLADLWRLEELEFSYGNFTEQWWYKRKNIQGVNSNTNLEPDFLGDSFLNSNKPYLSKFLGIFLQFQLADYYKKYFGTENGTTAQFIKRDENFRTFVSDRPNKKWPELVDFQYGFNEISSTALLEYFRPLEEYLDRAPLKQVIISTTPKPRTTKSTTKPTRRRAKGLRKLESQLTGKNETSSIQNDEGKTDNELEKVSPESSTTETKTGKMTVIIGIAGVLCVGIILIVVVKRLKKRQKTNNRRFET